MSDFPAENPRTQNRTILIQTRCQTFKKMRTNILTIVFFIGILSVVNAQDSLETIEMVGFSCGFAGSPSETVEKFATKLYGKNYEWIAKQLTSKNSAEKYMSVITLEKLNALGKYILNETELRLIAEIKQSFELVSVCSGCTNFQKVELKNMFTVQMMTMSSFWLDYNIKTE